jgi:spermidine synthase
VIAERKAPRVLIGGLGFGYTLRAALDHLPKGARVVVCEVFASLLEWNRGLLADLAGRPLEDRRVTAVRDDVRHLLDGRERFDAILLDVDNGPEAFTLRSNAHLYSKEGLGRLSRSLTAGGVLAVWSSSAAPDFVRRLRKAGFEPRTERVAPRGGAGRRSHVLFFARWR